MHDDHRAAAATIESVLCDSALSDQVEMVLSNLGDDTYRAASADGSVEFRRRHEPRGERGGAWAYDVTSTTGVDPLADNATDRFIGHACERDAAFPHRSQNAYPYAHDSIAQFFDGDHAPELVAVHAGGHHFNSHFGEHGSPCAVQSRAPFIAAGAGVRAEGLVDRHARMVDFAPTVARVLGLPSVGGIGPDGSPRPDAMLARQDGDPIDVLDGARAEHVVVLLLDGCNANLLYDVIDSGEAPNLAQLVGRGTAFRHGLLASLPTATLANHTAAVTGAHPGHSGVLHNTWFDRYRDEIPDLLAMDQIHSAMVHLDPRVETLWQAIHRYRPDAFTTATFEFCDSGASHSSFGQLREGLIPAFPDMATMPHLDREHAAASKQYSFMSMVDHESARQTVSMWDGSHGNALPTLSWVGLAITDEAGHESGPHGDAARAAVRDSDGRVGDVLAAVERAGALDRTAVFVIADHGMEQNDATNTASWSDALTETGVAHRDVEGFIYLD